MIADSFCWCFQTNCRLTFVASCLFSFVLLKINRSSSDQCPRKTPARSIKMTVRNGGGVVVLRVEQDVTMPQLKCHMFVCF